MNSSRARLVVALFVTATILVAPAPDAHAANWIGEVLDYEGEKGVHEVEVVLSGELSLTSAFNSVSPREFRARARAASADDGSWSYAELKFDEPGNDLKRVAVEGSANKGFDVILEFHRTVHLQTLPQYASNRFSVLHSNPRTFRSLARFSNSANPQFAPVALRFTLAGGFAVDAIPSAIVKNRKVYHHPEVPDEIRIGFFPTRTAADVVLRELRGTYPDISVVHVSASEIEYANVFNIYTDRLVAIYGLNESRQPLLADAPAPSLSIRAVTPQTIDAAPDAQPALLEWEKELDRSILDQAREAYLDDDFNRAIALYTKASNDPRLREEATEMLGVARERNGQLAHAKAVYERFLHTYPDSPAASRVEQRLQSLIGNSVGLATLRQAQGRSRATWSLAGNLSQFYRRHSIEINHQDTAIPINALFSDANTIARYQGESTTHEARISIGHIQNFSDQDVRTLHLRRAYWTSFFDKYDVGFSAGRQSLRGTGVLGRFDGLTARYRQHDNLQWTLVGGYLVDYRHNGLSTDRPFYGLNAKLQMLDGRLEISPFYVEQQRDGVLDRRAVGAQTHYYSDRFIAGTLVDYDIYHQALNNLHLTSSYNLNDAWRVNGAYEFRRSPYLTTSNAMIGQRYDDLSELERSLIDMKLEDIAEDRTATSNLFRIGIDGKLNGTWSVSTDASVSDYSATDTSLGVNGLDSHRDYYLTTELRATDVFTDNSYSAIQLRYMASDNSESSMLYLTNRFRWNDLMIYPKFVTSKRKFKNNDQQSVQLRPSLRIDYRLRKRFRLEFEVGHEWSTRKTAIQDIDILGLYFYIGYRALF